VPPRILLADADAFFVAVARQIDPDGAGRAELLIVGGRSDQRGVVCSASYEARKFGVRSAMPTARALRLCPQAMVVPVPRQACLDRSRQISAVLARFAPVVAAASIDEWYLDLSGTERLYGEPLVETARRIRAAVQAETQLPLSIGGGTNKLVAKLAVELAKRPPPGAERGAHVVEPGEEAAFMTRFQLGDIPMVGPRLQERLLEFGLRSVADALPYEESVLCGMLGERTGHWLYQRIRGICDMAVSADEDTKSIGREETFPTDLHSDDALRKELLTLLSQAAAELRRCGFRTRTLTIKVKDPDFTQRQKSRTLPEAVESERTLWPLAQELLAELRQARAVGVRLLGVSLSSLVAATDDDEAAAAPAPVSPAGQQLGLFALAAPPPSKPAPLHETSRDRAVARLRDAVREKFGDEALRPAECTDSNARTRS